MDGAVFADDVAAPLEAAVALLDAFLLDDVVAASAAQRRAVVHAAAGAVALSPSRAREVEAGVSFAEIGRLLVVKQFGGQVVLAHPSAAAAAALGVAVFHAFPPPPTALGLAVPRPAAPLEALLLDEQRQSVAQVGLVDQDRLAETLLQRVAHQPEFGRRFPARF